MAKIIFINRFFYPDQSATSLMLTDLAFSLAEEGYKVHVIASRATIAGADRLTDLEDAARGVAIHRVGGPARSAGLMSRFVSFLSFYWSAAFLLRAHADEGAIVVAMTDPPLLSVWASWLLRSRRVRLINWLQDIYPEIAIRLNVRLVRGPVGAILTWLRDRSLRRAHVNVVLGAGMARAIESRGAPSVRVIPNWADDRSIRPVARDANPLRRAWGFGDAFVFGYSGNLGRAHEFDTVLAAAEHFRGRADLRLLFVGGGYRVAALKDALRARGLEHLAVFMPYRDTSELSNALSVADAHWLSLRSECEGLIVPSKFYGIAAAGRPVIAITDRRGEIATLVEAFQCGAVVEPGNGAALAGLLEAMIAERALREKWGRNARAMIESDFSRARAVAKWRDVLAAPALEGANPRADELAGEACRAGVSVRPRLQSKMTT
jgi:colanic acid biosynthesis glycosyl transferase WcaI